MTKPHKHAALIKAWADGAQIQNRHSLRDGWLDIPNPGWYADEEYRIKPPALKYRRYIGAGCFIGSFGVFCFQWNMRDKFNPEKQVGFVRWIDNDWVEVEIEKESA